MNELNENDLRELREYNDLVDTVEAMKSPDYKERFIAEYMQTRIRYRKLNDMVIKWDKGELNFMPTCPRALYDKQLKAMKDYLDILEIRASLEKVYLG